MPDEVINRRPDGKAINEMEAAFRNALHGVETPRQLDFLSKKIAYEYEQFKILTKRIITLLDQDYPEDRTVNKILMWMGPVACEKYEKHAFQDGEKNKLTPMWTLFDRLCHKKDGSEGSYDAARYTLKFIRQKQGEPVDIFYSRIRDKLAECEYETEEAKLMERETLKYGFVEAKVIDGVYKLKKNATVHEILSAAQAEEAHQR